MNPLNPPALATVSTEGPHPTLALDLDLEARITEDPGRDAVLGRADQPPFDTYITLRAIPTTDDMLVTATRLFNVLSWRAPPRNRTTPTSDPPAKPRTSP